MKTKAYKRSDAKMALALLSPSILLLLVLVAYPMISNIQISFLELPLNPNLDSTFIGLQNYIDILTDAEFYKSLALTFGYTILVVVGSTGMGLLVAIFFNREFRFRKTARSLIIL